MTDWAPGVARSGRADAGLNRPAISGPASDGVAGPDGPALPSPEPTGVSEPGPRRTAREDLSMAMSSLRPPSMTPASASTTPTSPSTDPLSSSRTTTPLTTDSDSTATPAAPETGALPSGAGWPESQQRVSATRVSATARVVTREASAVREGMNGHATGAATRAAARPTSASSWRSATGVPDDPNSAAPPSGVPRNASWLRPRRLARWHRPYAAVLIVMDVVAAALASLTATSQFSKATAGFKDAPGLFQLIAYVLLPLAWVVALWAHGAYDRRYLGIGTVEFKRVIRAFGRG